MKKPTIRMQMVIKDDAINVPDNPEFHKLLLVFLKFLLVLLGKNDENKIFLSPIFLHDLLSIPELRIFNFWVRQTLDDVYLPVYTLLHDENTLAMAITISAYRQLLCGKQFYYVIGLLLVSLARYYHQIKRRQQAVSHHVPFLYLWGQLAEF